MGRGIHLGVEGAGTTMSDTGGLIVYKIIGWKITTMEIKGGARAPPWIRPCRHCLGIVLIAGCISLG